MVFGICAFDRSGRFCRPLDERGLSVEERLSIALLVQIAEGAERRVRGVRAQLAQLRRVLHADGEILDDALAELLAQDRPGNLDALVEVARHEVGARQVHPAVIGRAEAVDAAVLEQPADDRHDAHVLGCTPHLGDEAADAADEQRDPHARTRRFGDLLDDFLVGDGVRLQERATRLALTRQHDLPVEVLHDHGLDLQRGDAQHLVVVRDVLELHVAEELDGIAAERLALGDEAEVGVELGRLLVVVARTQLRDVLDAVIGLARDAADLGMHLVFAETVDDVAPRLLEALRPLDVVALVEAGAQLEERGDLLAVLGGRDERLGELRLARQAVQGDLDGNDARVESSLFEQLNERVHALIGVREQDVAVAHLIHDAAVAVERRGPSRRERRVRQPGALRLRQAASQPPGEAQVERHDGVVDLAALEAELLEHVLFHDRRERALALEAHRRQARALLQQAAHMLAVILVLLVARLVGVDVGITRDADDVGVLDLVHAEDLARVHLDGMLEQDELEATAGQLDNAVALVRQRDEAEHDALGTALALLLFLALLILLVLLGIDGIGFVVEAHEDVELAVLQMRERMARIDDLRRQEGLNVELDEARQVVALFFGQVVGTQMAHALLRERAAHVLVVALLDGIELAAALVDGLDLLLGGHAGLGIDDRRIDEREVGQAAHAHHEELLEVAPEDRYEVEALEQRHRLVGPLVEHALVERQPRQLPVLHVGTVGGHATVIAFLGAVG